MDFTPDKIRNVMVAGHSSSGKTSFVEALLHLTKFSERLGSVADGNTVTDFDPEEIKRKASISTAIAPYEYKGCKVNLIDSPGLFDFELGLYEGIMAAESVIIAVSGRSGVSVGAHKANKLANKKKKARMFYVSKMASENADFAKTFADLKENFGMAVCPVVVAITEEKKPTVYADLMTSKAFTYVDGKESEVEFPKDDPQVAEYYKSFIEAIAESDEELLEKFLAEEPFTYDEIVKGLKEGVRSCTVAPVVCGDALKLEGIGLALHVINEVLPTAADAEGVLAFDKDGNELFIKCGENDSTVGFIFKTVADPFVGKLSFIKVISGKFSADGQFTNATTGEVERLGKLLSIKGKKQTDVKEIKAGDIGAITKLDKAKTGDTLCSSSKVVKVKPLEFPTPSFSMSIRSTKKGDESKISGAIQRLCEEDRTISYHINSETVQQILSGLGEQHIDVIVSKLKSKFGVEVALEAPRVAYRETIRKKVKVQGRHKKQSGGHGQFGDVWIEFEPHSEGEDLIFEDKVFGGAVPKNFFPAVEKGLRDSIKKGVLAGYPVVGLKARLVDGSYHPVDSSEMAFKMAASLAYKAGLAQASPVLLEPIMAVKALVPDSNTGDIMGEVTKRRGRVVGMNPDETGMQLVDAEIPQSELHDFTTYMRSSTQGRGSFTMEFLRYEPLPATHEGKVIEDAKKLKAEEVDE